MECTKPRAICGQGYSWEINFLLWIRKKGGFDPLWRWEKHDAASSSFIPRPDRSRSRNHTYKFVAGDLLGSSPGWRMTLQQWFGPILYINHVTSTNENALRLHWVPVYARKLNCGSVQPDPAKTKHHHINREWRHAEEILRRCSSECCKCHAVPGVQNHSSLLKSIQMLSVLTGRLKKPQQLSVQLGSYYCIE